MMAEQNNKTSDQVKDSVEPKPEQSPKKNREEQGGVDRLEPTRYGDWEKAGRCIDF